LNFRALAYFAITQGTITMLRIRHACRLLLFVLLAIASPLSADERAAKSADKSDDGFVSLFNGKDLGGWQGAKDGYEVEDGVLASKKSSGGNIYTDKEYEDFTFRFEFKLEPGANNGVALRAPTKGDAAYVGLESQILDDGHESYKGIAPYQSHGSIYGVIPAKRGFLKKTGEWNTQEITLKGRHVKVVLNGETIVDGDLDKASTPKTIDGQNHPGLKNEKGHIGFCGHGARIEFRNLAIKVLE
jgi:hypothetical protein